MIARVRRLAICAGLAALLAAMAVAAGIDWIWRKITGRPDDRLHDGYD